MSSLATQANDVLAFTDSAAAKVRQLIEDEGNDKLMLRVFVQGGGCSGFQYGFTFDEEIQDGDTVVENSGVKLLIDPMSFQYLMGAEIDYTECDDHLRLRLVVLSLATHVDVVPVLATDVGRVRT